MLKYWSSR